MSVSKVELLGGTVTVISSGQRKVLTGTVTPLLIAILAMSGRSGISRHSLAAETGIHPGNALQQRISTLRKIGLPVELSGEKYRLLLDTDNVDALALIAAAHVDRAEQTYASVTDALSLWGEGPPSIGTTRLWRDLHEAKALLEKSRKRLTPRRLLIVEDKVGQRLCGIFGDYTCTLVENLSQFWSVFCDPNHVFDAALVDLHLGADYRDNDGLIILDAINRSNSDLPVIVMTYRPPQGRDYTAFQRRYNLAAFVSKTGDDETADFIAVADAVHELFAVDTYTRLLEALEDNLPSIGRYAEKWLIKNGRVGDVALMWVEHERLYAIARKKDLGALREAVGGFQAKYGSPPAPTALER